MGWRGRWRGLEIGQREAASLEVIAGIALTLTADCHLQVLLLASTDDMIGSLSFFLLQSLQQTPEIHSSSSQVAQNVHRKQHLRPCVHKSPVRNGPVDLQGSIS